MAVWESRDEGLHWRRTRMLTQGSAFNHGYARRPLHVHPSFLSFWADGDADGLSASRLYFTDRRGRVFQMPYRMEAAFQRPVRVFPH
jgi:hypothetical protein